MKWIKQKHKHGCAVACLAMIAGIGYYKALALLHPNRSPRKSTLTTGRSILNALFELNIPSRFTSFNMSGENIKGLAHNAIIIYNNGDDMNHAVVYDADKKKILDPLNKSKPPRFSKVQENLKLIIEVKNQIFEILKFVILDKDRGNAYILAMDSSAPQDDPLVMYLIVNEDLNMSIGKTSAQTAHGSQLIMMDYFTDIAHKDYKSHHINMQAWFDSSYRKVVLKADKKEFAKLKELQEKHILIVDAGLTELEPGSETCIAFWPMRKGLAPKIIKKLQVL